MLATTRWIPFEELTNLHREMDRTFAQFWGDTGTGTNGTRTNGYGFVPATEITSDPNAWHVRIALPGVDPKEVAIDLHGNALTIRGERTNAKRDSEPHVSEISYGRFERTFSLPAHVDGNKVEARYDNGMLELTLPVAESAKPRRIEINGRADAA